LRHPLSSRKGVSEIIAVMLLIAIAVAASVLMYVYVSGLMGSLQGVKVQQSYLDRVALDYYDWSGESKCSTNINVLCLTVRNVGVTKVTMSDFFINGRSNTTGLTFGTGCNTPQRGVLNVGSSCVLAFPVPSGFAPTAGVAYNVKVVTSDGAILSYSCIAGQAA
jgi:archaeal type IV pilus assembly protein PilA